MATTTTTTTQTAPSNPTHSLLPRRVCFSFAAYSKSIINHLRSSSIAISPGLSDAEFAAIESAHRFLFPPDLRSILREGLPVAPGFPNWRSASPTQLHILLSLPISSLLHQISISGGLFWPPLFGPRPQSPAQSISTARSILSKAAQLVPVYRHFYIAANPNLAGNPLFYINGGDVRCCAFDLADFFRREGICLAPAWAAKEARRVDVWSDLAGKIAGKIAGEVGVEEFVEEMGGRLRAGGWSEEEVREMLVEGGSDGCDAGRGGDRTVGMGRGDVLVHVRGLAQLMIRAGWSEEDVVYAFGRNVRMASPTRHVDHAVVSSTSDSYLIR